MDKTTTPHQSGQPDNPATPPPVPGHGMARFAAAQSTPDVACRSNNQVRRVAFAKPDCCAHADMGLRRGGGVEHSHFDDARGQRTSGDREVDLAGCRPS